MGRKQEGAGQGLVWVLSADERGVFLVCAVCTIFKMQISREEAKEKLHDWYKKVNACTLREVKASRNTIKAKEEHVLNYFINRSTNASAESLNSEIKSFRGQVHGVADVPFLLYRVCTIFGYSQGRFPTEVLNCSVVRRLSLLED